MCVWLHRPTREKNKWCPLIHRGFFLFYFLFFSPLGCVRFYSTNLRVIFRLLPPVHPTICIAATTRSENVGKYNKGWNFGVFETPEKNERIGERERERGKSYMGDDEEKKGKQQQQQHQGGWLYRRRIA